MSCYILSHSMHIHVHFTIYTCTLLSFMHTDTINSLLVYLLRFVIKSHLATSKQVVNFNNKIVATGNMSWPYLEDVVLINLGKMAPLTLLVEAHTTPSHPFISHFS